MDLYLNGKTLKKYITPNNLNDIKTTIKEMLNIDESNYYLLQNGKRLTSDDTIQQTNIHICLRIVGGKGGFGSMLRAIGAQIEKTTNREACRDLSGRRLRDINEEKRLKTWLEQQKEKEEEADDKKKKKLEKMLTLPKHEFKDEVYEQARTELTQQIDNAVEQGMKNAQLTETKTNKRKIQETAGKNNKKLLNKKPKGTLWLGDDDLSSSSENSSSENDSSSDESEEKTEIKELGESSKTQALAVQ